MGKVLVLFCKKELKGKRSSRQESTGFIKAKVHTGAGSGVRGGDESKNKRARVRVSHAEVAGYELSVLPGDRTLENMVLG